MSQQAQKRELRPGPIHSELQEFVIITGKNKFQNLRNPTAQALRVRPKLLFFSRKFTIVQLHLHTRVTSVAHRTCKSTEQELGSRPHFSDEAKRGSGGRSVSCRVM